jgi:2-polyprenyl-3-methyl-5-hydroxy-6-metoxy-1,4-benzoquinol methylase/predicted sugar kinase
MKTDYKPFKVGQVFNPFRNKVKNNFPILKSVEILFPSRLNAMSVDPGKITENKNMVYTAGEIVFSIPVFKKINIKVIDSAECDISSSSKRKSLIKHAFLIMKKVIGFENGLEIDVDNENEIKHQGMGSSSSLLAGVCTAINEIYGCPLKNNELLRYVAQNHGEEIEGEDELLIPVQCLGGSAASGLYEGGVLLLLGESVVVRTANIPEEYSVVLGFPKDFKEVDSQEALKKELESIEGFVKCGELYGKANAYNILHEFIPAMIEQDVDKMGDVIYDYRFNMGSIKNCSFLYSKLEDLCNRLAFLKKEGHVSALSISSVGPLVFAITKNPLKCVEAFEKENLKTDMIKVYNKKYQVLNSIKSEDVFWDEQSIFFANKEPCSHIKKVLERFDQSKGNKLLDVGCGGGRNLISAIDLGFDAYGIDFSESMINEARKKLKGCEEKIKKKDILEINTIKDKFNVIIASGVIHQAKSKDELIKVVDDLSNLIEIGGILVGNIFLSGHIDPSLNCVDEGVYITKEGLSMTLISGEEFIRICKNNKLQMKSPIINETKDVGTGYRTIMRFEFEKIK